MAAQCMLNLESAACRVLLVTVSKVSWRSQSSYISKHTGSGIEQGRSLLVEPQLYANCTLVTFGRAVEQQAGNPCCQRGCLLGDTRRSVPGGKTTRYFLGGTEKPPAQSASSSKDIQILCSICVLVSSSTALLHCASGDGAGKAQVGEAKVAIAASPQGLAQIKVNACLLKPVAISSQVEQLAKSKLEKPKWLQQQ